VAAEPVAVVEPVVVEPVVVAEWVVVEPVVVRDLAVVVEVSEVQGVLAAVVGMAVT